MSRRGMTTGRRPKGQPTLAETAYAAYGEWCDTSEADDAWMLARDLRDDGLIGDGLDVLEHDAEVWLKTKCTTYRGLSETEREAFKQEVFEHIQGGLS